MVNNYNYGGANNTTIVNNGISVDRVSAATHHPVTVVAVNELPNATRHGWRGEDRNTRAPGGTANNADGQNRHTPGSPNNSANNANLHQPGSGAKNGNVGSPVIIDQNGQRGRGNAVKDSNTQARNQNGSPVVNNNNVSADAGHQSVRRMGAVSQTQNQNEPPAADNSRAQIGRAHV